LGWPEYALRPQVEEGNAVDLGLQDTVAVVTGRSRDIGRAVALTFAAEGARVAVRFTSAPLNKLGRVASPPNAVAIK
jgi:NAD(P)-dependent dehydrogenase (short-subunit alcohol dehydrogenase family)